MGFNLAFKGLNTLHDANMFQVDVKWKGTHTHTHTHTRMNE